MDVWYLIHTRILNIWPIQTCFSCMCVFVCVYWLWNSRPGSYCWSLEYKFYRTRLKAGRKGKEGRKKERRKGEREGRKEGGTDGGSWCRVAYTHCGQLTHNAADLVGHLNGTGQHLPQLPQQLLLQLWAPRQMCVRLHGKGHQLLLGPSISYRL
jgi:hypothetical protein